MTVELIYKTTSPKALEWWTTTQDTLERDRLTRNQIADDLCKEFGPGTDGTHRDLWIGTGWNGEIFITGMAPAKGEWDNPPEGWRSDRNKGHLVPALRTARGKALAREFENARGLAWRENVTQIIGVPRHVESNHLEKDWSRRLFEAGFAFDEETQTLYQTWSSGVVEERVLAAQAEVPEVVWVEVKRSEWYAYQETKVTKLTEDQ